MDFKSHLVSAVMLQCLMQAVFGAGDEDRSQQDVVLNKGGGEIKTTNVSGCFEYHYCQGEKFPEAVSIGDKTVKCDQGPDPKTKCCLAEAPHLVCYNIKIGDNLLFYDMGDPVQGTDFTDLCKMLVNSQNKTLGQYTSMRAAVGGGVLRYRYQEWDYVAESQQHVQHIACEVTDLETPEPEPEVKDEKEDESKETENEND